MSGSRAPSVLIVIPARGGSKGIPRKNLRSLRGRPLIAYAIATAMGSSFQPTVLVTSDDEEILSVAQALGAIPHRRPFHLGGDAVTLDGVVFDALQAASSARTTPFDVVVTIQPTSPLIRAETVDAAIDRLWASSADLDSVLTGVDDTHLRWVARDGGYVPAYESRLNRQFLPKVYRETGGVFATRAASITPNNRIGERASLLILHGAEAIDIDGPDDWALAEWHMGRRDVLFVVTGNAEVGLGHAHNVLAVADALTRHHVRFLVDRESQLAAETIATRNHPVSMQSHDRIEQDVKVLGPDVVINDRLDTSAEYVGALKADGRIVVNFEDLGPGALLADLVINAIYPEPVSLPNHYVGNRYYCPRPEFVVTQPSAIRDRVRRVLITFGGTDPNNLTERVARVISDSARAADIEIEVICGLGYRHPTNWANSMGVTVHRSVANMARHMADADIVFTSAGRTTFEVACVGTPSIVIAQNARELSHLFATHAHGFANLGLAEDLRDADILDLFTRLAGDHEERAAMHRRMTDEHLNGGLERVRLLIEGVIAT